MWTHTVLEIYPKMSINCRHTLPFPTEGKPADWIEQGLVAYCQGREEDLIQFIPLRRIIRWKLRHLAVYLRWWAWGRFQRPLDLEKRLAELGVSCQPGEAHAVRDTGYSQQVRGLTGKAKAP